MNLPIRGITLIEILIVTTIIGFTIIPIAISAKQTSQSQGLKTSVSVFVDDLQEAKNYARNARNQSAWAIKSVDNKSYNIVYGTDTNYAVLKYMKLENGIVFSNPFSVWFRIQDGSLSGDSLVELKNNIGNKYQVNINPLGVITVTKF